MADDRGRDRDDSDDDDKRESSGQPNNPFEALFGPLGMSGGPGGTPDLNALMQQFQQALSQMGMGNLFGMPQQSNAGDGWEAIRDVARRVVASLGTDPTPSAKEAEAIRDAVRLADTWLDQATTFSALGAKVEAWSRAEWVENTMATWRRIIEPVSASMAEAMANTVAPENGTEQPGGFEAMLRPWLKSSGSSIFNLQAGQAIGQLAAVVLSGTETGLPLHESSAIALVPVNVAAFHKGLSQSREDVILYLTLRETARQRLFSQVSWLGPQILSLVEQYARGITIDTSALEQAMGEFQFTDFTPETMERLSETLQGSLFEPKQTPEQKETLLKLETVLALVEGWVEDVVAQSTAQWMPNAVPLAEQLRRRRATDGPAEATFRSLVGLELRPRRLRDAANLFAAVREGRGMAARDAIWKHPDLLPTAEDLDDPLGFGGSELGKPANGGDDLDAELARLLDEADRGPQRDRDDQEDDPA